MKYKKTEYNKVIDEKAEREKAKAEKIMLLENEIAKAKKTLDQATIEYDKATDEVDSEKMLSAGMKKQQAEAVLNALNESLEHKSKERIFSDKEADIHITSLMNEVVEINNSTAHEVAELLQMIEKVIKKNTTTVDEYNSLIRSIYNKGHNSPHVMRHQIVINLDREINFSKQNFKDLFETENK